MTTCNIGMVSLADHLGLYERSASEFPVERDGIRFQASDFESDDWLVLVVPNSTEFQTRVPIARRVLVVGEPSSMNAITAAYANQFGVLVSPYQIKGYRGFWFPSHGGLPWLIGLQRESGKLWSFQDFENLEPPPKQNSLSVVVSGKVFLVGHRDRLRFVQKLKKRLGSRLHLFGRGINEVDDKADAILPYAYHLAIENTTEPNYWTEKLSDAYLGYAFPLYVGCPNVGKWIDESAMKRISIRDSDSSVEEVADFLDTDDYASRLDSIKAVREHILHHETIFNVLKAAIDAAPTKTDRIPGTFTVEPLGKTLVSRIYREAYRMYYQLTARGCRRFD